MLRYLGEQILVSKIDVYHCEGCFVYGAEHICFVSFATDATAMNA